MKKQIINLMNNKPKIKQVGKVIKQFFEIDKRPLQVGFFVGEDGKVKFLNDVELLNEVKHLNHKPEHVYSFEVLDSLDISSDPKREQVKINGKTPVVFQYSKDISFQTNDGRKWMGEGINIEFMKKQKYTHLVLIESLIVDTPTHKMGKLANASGILE
ncbi:hypothetical protein AB447_203930 [Bacillus glycinifermentans]|nr:hypothetical protein AB447_203930 [Bacillus glycinifermentans]